MALSKPCFLILLLGILVIFGGAIALVVIFSNKNDFSVSSEETVEITDEESVVLLDDDDEKDSYKKINRGKIGSREECRGWLRSENEHWEFAGRYGRSLIATRETISAQSGNRIIRNAYWLTGDRDKDIEAMDDIRLNACMGKIPVIVIKMRPSDGLRLSGEASSWEFYKPASTVLTWNGYDALLNKIIQKLVGMPAIIVLEPDLLMFAFDLKNQQNRWINKNYEEEFLKRAHRVIKRLSDAWVYVDAGNAAYLSENIQHVDQMAKSLLRLPGLRGFSLNSMHFVNQSYNEFIARRLHCRTGLHYIVDTSRNGGPFSRQAIRDIQQCYYDPPNIKKGQSPGFSWGTRTSVLAPRQKRWISQLGSSAPVSGYVPPSQQPLTTTTVAQVVHRNDPNWELNNRNNRLNDERNNRLNNGKNDGYDRPQPSVTTTEATEDTFVEVESEQTIRSVTVASEYLRTFRSNLRSCMSKKSTTSAHDANVWIKAPGEADGRLYKYGTYHSCLLGHSVECSDQCQMFIQEPSSNCQCGKPNRNTVLPKSTHSPFPIANFPLK